MKLYRRFLFLSLFLSLFGAANSQVYLGYRNARHVYVGYNFNKLFSAEVEHSLYAEKFGFQRVRLYGNYQRDFNAFGLMVSPYFGTLWNGDYQDFGALVAASYTLGRFTPAFTANPNYDTQLKFKFNYSALLSVRVIKELDIFGEFTTVPEYRISEKQLRLGGDFHVGKLSARPIVSLPVEDGVKSVRVYCDFRFTF